MNTKLKTLSIALFALVCFSHSISGQVFQNPNIKQKKTTADYLSSYYKKDTKRIGEMEVSPDTYFYKEPRYCKFEIAEAVRIGPYVKVYFNLTNTLNPPRPTLGTDLNLSFSTKTSYDGTIFGCSGYSEEYENGKPVPYKIVALTCQGRNNSKEMNVNIPPQETVTGHITFSGVPINVKTLHELCLHFKYSIAYNKSSCEFRYFVKNMPIVQYIVNEHGVNDLDCTVPISKLPKEYPGLYSKIQIESVVNEMDGYTETYVNFINYKKEVVMTGISYEEGAGKRINQLVIKSNKIHSPEGAYVGMTYQELCKLGAVYYRQWWSDRIKLNSAWIDIPTLTAEGKSFHNIITRQHEMATRTKSDDYITQTKLSPKYFSPNTKVTEFTYDLITNR